jgi:hypothetical protein
MRSLSLFWGVVLVAWIGWGGVVGWAGEQNRRVKLTVPFFDSQRPAVRSQNAQLPCVSFATGDVGRMSGSQGAIEQRVAKPRRRVIEVHHSVRQWLEELQASPLLSFDLLHYDTGY